MVNHSIKSVSAFKSSHVATAALSLVLLTGFSAVTQIADAKAIAQATVAKTEAIRKSSEYGDMQNGKDFVATMTKVAQGANDYTFKCVISTYKDGKVIKEGGQFYYKKPNMMKMEVTNGAKKGAVAVLGTDGKVRGHLGGMLSMFSGTIGKDSNMLRSANGFSMMDSDYETLLRDLNKQLAEGSTCIVTVNPVAIASAGGAKQHVVEVYKNIDSDKDKELTQRIFVDVKSNLPEQWNLYRTEKLFSSTDWKDIKVNIGLTEDDFSLKPKKGAKG